MKIKIICVGKLKEKYLEEGVKEYLKRLSAYCDVEVIEVGDERIPENPSLAEEMIVKSKEGRRILDKVKQDDYMILLDADISFCMVCKLWYISIRCIFKNLALKLRIYNFRGVCVCICPPCLPSSYTKHLPFIPSIILPFPLFKRCSECLRLCLLSTFRFYSYSC